MNRGRKHPDWDCSQCPNRNIFGSHDKCPKCGCFRSKGRPAGGGTHVASAGPPPKKPGDWDCTCGVSNFAKRDVCFVCGEHKPIPVIAIPSAAQEVASASPVCVVCTERPLEVRLKNCNHICLCQQCANTLSACPMCRVAYDASSDVDKVFIAHF